MDFELHEQIARIIEEEELAYNGRGVSAALKAAARIVKLIEEEREDDYRSFVIDNERRA